MLNIPPLADLVSSAKQVRPFAWVKWLVIAAAMVFVVTLTSAATDPMGNSTGGDEPQYDVRPAPAVAAAAAAQQVISEIVNVVGQAFRAVASNSGLKTMGESITYFLVITVFAWGLLKAMVEGGGINAVVSELVPLMMSFAVIYALLNLGGIGHIVGFMDGVASAIAGAPMGTFESALTNSASMTFKIVADIFSMPSIATRLSLTEPGLWVPILAMFMLQLIAKLVTAFFVVLALGIYLANIVLAYGSIMLASALAFIMVPFMLLPALSFIFEGWLRFTLGAAMTKVVGAFFLAFTSKLMAGMVVLAKKVVVPPESDFTTLYVGSFILYCGLIMLAVLCAYLMMQVPGLATGLLSGSAGAAGFKGMRALTGGMAGGIGRNTAISSGRATFGTKGADGARVGGAAGAVRAAGGALVSRVQKNPVTLRSDPAKTVSQTYGRTGAKVYGALGGRTAQPTVKAPSKDSPKTPPKKS
ncbi:type IV secretion system protein [Acidovorax sp. LjRoot118]|uniref:type IV secretion system protein n=1 Tax=Acidovorax sp. LjRoot118 TaxID=3342256 RepID=UPI003ECFB35D